MANEATASANRFRFRAWNNHTGKIVDLKEITPLALDANLDQDGVFIPFGDNFIAMQSTGLLDKNGMEIFEGDLIQMPPDGPFLHRVEEVVFWEGCFCFKRGEKGHIFNPKDYAIVGNIYENPELLK